MYSYYGTDNKKNYAMMFICLIIGVAIGAAVSGGTTSIIGDDTDNVTFGVQETFVSTDADNLFYAITGNHFTDVGSIYDRCTRRGFNTFSLEVNILSYSITLSGGDNAMVYVLKENLTDTTNFIIIDQFQTTTNVENSVSVWPGDNIIIIVFYLNVRTVSISGRLYHG